MQFCDSLKSWLEAVLTTRFLGRVQNKKISKNFWRFFVFRAGNGTRTRDLRLGKPPLYQLSYSRLCFANLAKVRFATKFRPTFCEVAQPLGLEVF